jgi:hypothetical protein
MTDSNMPKVTQLGQVTTSHLDVNKLIEAAKAKLEYAENEIRNLRKEDAMKRKDIEQVYRNRIDDAEAEADRDIRALAYDIDVRMKAAGDMIKLVKKMLA